MYLDEDDAKLGSRSGGTAFIIGVPFEGYSKAPLAKIHKFLVTNAHVIERGYEWARFMGKDGTAHIIDLRHEWFLHRGGDDLAIALLPSDRFPAWKTCRIQRNMLATKEKLKARDIGIGDDVVFIGRFIGHDGVEINTPSLRFGNISMMPGQPIPQSERKNFPQISYLIEGRSIGGFSGSPVFFYEKPAERHIDLAVYGLLLGVDWGHINCEGDIVNIYDTSSGIKSPHLKGRYSSGMMGVVPAWKLDELLDASEICDLRRQVEEEARSNSDPGVVLDADGLSAPPGFWQ